MRTVREYFLARGILPPPPNDIVDKDRQMDIRYHFTRGLSNKKVAEHVRLHLNLRPYRLSGALANEALEAL